MGFLKIHSPALIFFALISATSAETLAAIAFVQAGATNKSGATTAFSTPVKAGNTIICTPSVWGTGASSYLTITDDAAGGSNQYSTAVTSQGNGYDYEVAILYSVNVKSATTITMSTDLSASLSCFEFSGIGGVDPGSFMGSGGQADLTTGIGSLGPTPVAAAGEMMFITAIMSGAITTPTGGTALDGNTFTYLTSSAGTYTLPLIQVNNTWDLYQVAMAGFIPQTAACTSPAGTIGAFTYNTSSNLMSFCNGSAWVPMNGLGSTNGTCTGQTGHTKYTGSFFEYCNGTNWINMTAYSPGTCSAALAGALTYDGNMNAMKFCDGANWQSTTPGFAINSINQSNVFGGYTTATYNGPNLAGDFLLAVVSRNGTVDQSAMTVSDSAGNSWWGLPPAIDNYGNVVQMFYAANAIASGSNTVTFSDALNGLTGMGATLSEFSGIATSNPVDVMTTTYGTTTGGNVSIGPLTATNTDTFIAGWSSDNGSYGRFTPVAPFRRGTDVQLSEMSTLAPQVTPSGSSVTATSLAPPGAWRGILAGFRNIGSLPPNVPTKIVISSAALNAKSDTCQAITFQSQTPGGTAAIMQTNSTITPTASGAIFYLDAKCTQTATFQTLWAGVSSVTMYAMFSTPGSISLSATVTNGFTAPAAQTETITQNPGTWTGAGDGSTWTLTTNWATGVVPTSTTDVVFNANSCTVGCNIYLPNSAVTVNSIKSYGGVNFNYSGSNSTMTVTGDAGFYGGGGTVIFNGLTVGGNLTDWTGTLNVGCSESSCTTLNAGNPVTIANVMYSGLNVLSATTITGNVISSNINNSSTITFTGAAAVIDTNNYGGDSINGNIVYNHAGGSLKLGWTNLGNLSVTAGSVVDYGSGDITLANLTMASGTSLTMSAQYLTVSGATSASAATITLGGGATFSGNSNINKLTATSTAWQNTLTFGAGTTQTIGTGGLTLSGTAVNTLLLRSSTAGTQWNIAPAANYTVGQYLDVQDSKKTGSFTLHAGANNTNSGNNTGWLFP